MSFADKQTLDDLGLLGKYRTGSVYALFNQVHTRGGEQLLEEMFASPLSDAAIINRRSGIFQYLQGKRFSFPFNRQQMALVEDYLGAGGSGNRFTIIASTLQRRMMKEFVNATAYDTLHDSVVATLWFISAYRRFIAQFDATGADNPLQKEITQVRNILHDKRLMRLPQEGDAAILSWQRLADLHHLFVRVIQKEMDLLCELLYLFDVYISVAKVSAGKGFSYAKALPGEEHVFHAEDLKHPHLKNAVGNDLSLNRHRNVLFLTGANMAGKSTFMKSLGIAMYLAHMGFPVAAKNMLFSVKEGMFSSINVPDNLSMGYSHFYAEVRRVKTIATEVGSSRSLLVIFDELFKGTNVKDAFDATLAVTAAFAAYRNCLFVVSTHIIEVGERLRSEKPTVQFAYLPTVMEGTAPRYTYKLKEGITGDRHGMMIIEQERILDIIRGRIGD